MEGKRSIDVMLVESIRMLDEIVVISYGEMAGRNLTTSIATVDGEVLISVPFSTVGKGLKGKISGVRVHQTNFTFGAQPTFTVRGGSSIQKK